MSTERDAFEARVILRRAAYYKPHDLTAARAAIPPDEEQIITVGTGFAFQPVYSARRLCALAADVERRVEARGETIPWLRDEY